MIRGPTGCLRIDPAQPKTSQIKFLDKDVTTRTGLSSSIQSSSPHNTNNPTFSPTFNWSALSRKIHGISVDQLVGQG
jgi:hypothetical protein